MSPPFVRHEGAMEAIRTRYICSRAALAERLEIMRWSPTCLEHPVSNNYDKYCHETGGGFDSAEGHRGEIAAVGGEVDGSVQEKDEGKHLPPK